MKNALILRQKAWEGDSLAGVSRLSRTKFKVIKTGDPVPAVDVAFRWGCTAPLNRQAGLVVNSTEAIHLAANKPLFRKELMKDHLCPETWLDLNVLVDELVDGKAARGVFVVRPKQHARGADMRKCETAAELRKAFKDFGEGSYVSRLVEKKKEYRVLIVQGRVVQMVEKVPENRARLNWGTGNFHNIRWGDWKMDVIDMALDAHSLSKLDFSAVDVITDDKRSYVLEVNTAPELIGEYSQGVFSKSFDYIMEHGSDPIKLGEGKDWKSYIHPALSEMAVKG